MRTLLTLTLTAALVAFGVGPARGQSAPLKEEIKKAVDEKKAADERKAAEDRIRYVREVQEAHRKLQAELEARTAELRKLQEQKVAEERKRAAEELGRATKAVEGARGWQKTPETSRTPGPPTTPLPGGAGVVRWVVAEPILAGDPLEAIKPLLRSEDPKVAALAAQLAELLAKKTSEAKPMAVTGRLVLDAGRQTTVRVEGKPTAAGEPLKVVVFDRDVKTTKAEASGSSLRMSADGKTAAVIAADGSVTVFDTASGKEMMRFPVKK